MSDPMAALRDNDSASAQLQNASGPACDECRQRKVKCDRAQPACGNCARNEFSCEFSNRIKRVNHTRKLVDDVAGLNERLGSIDDATQQLMERMDAITELLHRSQITAQSSSQQSNLQRSADATTNSRAGHLDKEEAGTSDRVATEAPSVDQSVTGLQRYYGSFSTRALFYTARKIVEGVIFQMQNGQPNFIAPGKSTDHSPSIIKLSRSLDPAALPRMIQSFNRWSSPPYDEEDLGRSPQMVSLPPYHLLEESLPHFFDDACYEWPIFRKEVVLNAIQVQYAQHQSTSDIAWRLCLNNIILLSLSSRSERPGTNTALIKLMEKGILTSLVNNARRAINLTPYLMAPRLVNVQALLSLALVARDFAHYLVFEKALFFAFQVASAMGLQEEHGQEALLDSPESERRNVIWTIYALDKQRCFLRGSSCLIYQFECSVGFPAYGDSIFKEYWHAQLRLTCVMEEIYRTLYSPKVQSKTSQQSEESIKACDQQLRAWSSMHNSLLDATQETWGAQILFAQQLRYSHYSTRILIHRRGALVENQHTCLESAREALKIIQVLFQRVSKDRRVLVVLRRIFNSCSVMAYYELWLHVLYSPNTRHSEDMTLLVDFAQALESLVNHDYPQAYCARVSRAIRWCTEIVQIIQDIKVPYAPMTHTSQFPVYSPVSQLGAWETLTPAFFSTSPYGYDFVGGNATGMRTQVPEAIDATSSNASTFESKSPQQSWSMYSSSAMDTTGQVSIASLPNLDGQFASTGTPFLTAMNGNVQNQPVTEILDDNFLDDINTCTSHWPAR